MSYSVATRKQKAYNHRYSSWLSWFRNKYYAMRFWHRLTGYVPSRKHVPDKINCH